MCWCGRFTEFKNNDGTVSIKTYEEGDILSTAQLDYDNYKKKYFDTYMGIFDGRDKMSRMFLNATMTKNKINEYTNSEFFQSDRFEKDLQLRTHINGIVGDIDNLIDAGRTGGGLSQEESELIETGQYNAFSHYNHS